MSVRGLYVGGKSTGNQNLKRSRRTAPVAQTLGGGAATPEQIGVPALSPRAETQVAALQLERRQEEKELRGGDYVAAPAPTDDLTQIAKALGVFGQQFSNTLEAGIKYEGAEQSRAELKAKAIAAQGQAYGPFADFAELTRNLERSSADQSLPQVERERAEALLNDLRASGNRVRPYIASQSRVLQVQQNAMTLQLKANQNPVIGEDESGRELRLHDVAADDPRVRSWISSNIYGGITLTPSEEKQVSGVIQSSTINMMSAHQKKVVERQEALLVQESIANARKLGRLHNTAQPEESMPLTLAAKRAQVQQILDDPRMLGVSQATATQIQQRVQLAYIAGAQEANKNVDVKDVNEVWYSVDEKTGAASGIMVGPMLDRTKDGKVNEALLWANTQDPDWAITTENTAEGQQNTQRKTEKERLLTVAQLQYEEPLKQALGKLDTSNPASIEDARDAVEQLNLQIDADESIDDTTALALKTYNNKKLEEATAADFSILFERTKVDMAEKIADMSQGVYTQREVLRMLEENRYNLKPADYASLYRQASKDPDPVVKTGGERLAQKLKELRTKVASSPLYDDKQRAEILGGMSNMRQEFNKLNRDYLDNKLTEDEYLQAVENIKPPPQAQLALDDITSMRAFERDVMVKDIDRRGNYSASAFNGHLADIGDARPSKKLQDAHARGSRIVSANAVLNLYNAFRGGNSKGYDYKKLVRVLKKNNIDPLEFLVKQARAAAVGLDIPADADDQKNLEQVRQLLPVMEKQLADRPKEVSIDQTQMQSRLVATRQRTTSAISLLDSLLGVSPASAATLDDMELPPPSVPAQIATKTTQARPPANIKIGGGSQQQAIVNAASRVGIHPVHLAAVMSLETGGTFDPRSRNSLGYVGLIQFGEWEQKNYRITQQSSFEDQAAAAAQFLIDRGVKPGDRIERIYAAILIGNADGKLADGSDGMNTKDAYGTSVNSSLKRLSPGGGHYNNAVRFLRGS